MNTLHLMTSGKIGGIERLMCDYATYSTNKNTFVFLKGTGGDISDEIRANGNFVIELSNSKKNIIGTIKAIKKICKENNIDVCITHFASPIFFVTLIALKRWNKNIKTIVYTHKNPTDIAIDSAKNRIKNRFFVRACKSSDCVIAISKHVKERICEDLKVKPSKVKVIYNGVDIKKFASSNYDLKNPLRLIYVGRLVYVKGVQLIVDKLQLLQHNNIDFKFTIVGEGEYKTELVEKITNLNLNERVDFVGKRKNVACFLKDADIFIHIPICEEGFGITVVEAMLAGCICICNDKGALPEIIEDKVSGYIIKNNSDKEFLEVINNIILKRESNLKMICEAQKSASKYSIENYSKIMDNLIQTLN